MFSFIYFILLSHRSGINILNFSLVLIHKLYEFLVQCSLFIYLKSCRIKYLEDKKNKYNKNNDQTQQNIISVSSSQAKHNKKVSNEMTSSHEQHDKQINNQKTSSHEQHDRQINNKMTSSQSYYVVEQGTPKSAATLKQTLVLHL